MSVRWVVLTALTIVGAGLVVLSGRLWQHHLFRATVLINLGTGILVIVGVSLVAKYLERRIADVEADSRRIEEVLEDLKYAAAGLPAPPRRLNKQTGKIIGQWHAHERARFDRLEQNPKADALASLLDEAQRKGYVSRRGISVDLDHDLGLQFESKNGSVVRISLEARSSDGLRATFGIPMPAPSSLDWRSGRRFFRRRGVNFSNAMAIIKDNLRLKGFPDAGNRLIADEVWHSLMQTMRIAFGIRGNQVSTPLERVRGTVEGDWVITDFAIKSLSYDFNLPIEYIWDGVAVAAMRTEAAKVRQDGAFNHAITSAQGLLFLDKPGRKRIM
ncbi:hypothetical protein ABIA33_003974 [Streptacidiphilus sp. MAP12-16]|uniref:hypothetical protein n=1 Tax=Streptacidiphilus sp. MAP12-16 TaxID=3156300 RepID=UPI0035125F28